MHTMPETIAIVLATATARMRIAAESGDDDREDHGRERRVRSEHEMRLGPNSAYASSGTMVA